MENLFVCGASAFPHFGAKKLTLTMGVLTYRATERIISEKIKMSKINRISRIINLYVAILDTIRNVSGLF